MSHRSTHQLNTKHYKVNNIQSKTKIVEENFQVKFIEEEINKNKSKMSLLPYVFENCIPSRSNFGLGLYHPSEFWITPAERSLIRSLSKIPDFDGVEQKSHIGKDGFQVNLDVQHFQPNEISVKTVDNSVIVEAKHEERQDEHGYIKREFTRRYDLPKGFKAQDIVSSLSSDGILTVKAPPATQSIEGNTRQIQIQQTGPARLNVSKNEEKEIKKN